MLKASRSFLKVSLKTKEGNIDRIIDDELLHKGLDGGIFVVIHDHFDTDFIRIFSIVLIFLLTVL